MTDWNQRYAEADTPWDKGLPAPPLEELLKQTESPHWFGNGPIIVPGCGSGHDVRLLAKEFDAEVIGIDLAPLALERAKQQRRVGKERYQLASWFEFDLAQGQPASAIWEHTCYCAIDPSMREPYASSVRRLLQPGGHFFGVFFLETGSDQGPPWSSTLEELTQRFSQGFELIYQQKPTRHYPGREDCEIVLGWKRL